MIAVFGLFAVSAAPFSRRRFILFMAGLAAIAAVSIASEQRAANRDRAWSAPAAADGEATIVRFPQPMEDVHSDLRQIGLPWFLRRQGATAKVETRDDATIAIEVNYRGAPVGTYVEHLIALDAGRSKLLVAFVPKDMQPVDQFAAPITTKLDPVSLMRVVMAEHIRSNLNGGGFDMNVLTDTPGSRISVFRKAFADSGKCQNPQTDDFRPCSSEGEDANIRRAYRNEAARGGGR